MKKIFYWLPRGLAILFIVFISLFALDVFSEKNWPLALLAHLLPSFILIILTVIAWKNELLGGILFLFSTLVFLFFFHSTVIVVPTFLIGGLFLYNKYIWK